MLASLMLSPLAQAIVDIAQHHAPAGVTMGRIVDTLEGHGYEPEAVEREIWTLLSGRRLTPCGFVSRKVRRRDPMGEVERARSYELLFIPWSEELDRQLELQLREDEP